MYQHFRYNCGTLYNTAVRCDITAENGDSTGLTVWIIDWTDNFRISVLTAGNVLAYRLTGCCDQICMQKSLFV